MSVYELTATRKGSVLMSDYQRFLSYLYEYKNHQKSRNCGFTRMEVRDNLCRMECSLRLPPFPFAPNFQVYAFVPENGLLTGILLGTAAYRQGVAQGVYTFHRSQVADTPYNYEELGGIILTSDNGLFFGTAWKDVDIDPNRFTIYHPAAQPQLTAASVEEPTPAASNPAVSDEPEPNTTVVSTTEVHTPISAAPQLVVADDEEPAATPDPSILSMEGAAKVWPFFDDEIHSCIQLSANSISDLPKYRIPINIDPYLLRGCQCYHHFLLGRYGHSPDGSPGPWVLCVPGVFDDQERHFANIFGYVHFKPAHNADHQPGVFGYWYQQLPSMGN